MKENSMINSLRSMLQDVKEEHQHSLLRTGKKPVKDTDIHEAITKLTESKSTTEKA